MSESDSLSNYRPRASIGDRLWFWLRFLIETFTRRRVVQLARLRLKVTPALVEGIVNIPRHGLFVLAVNHFKGQWSAEVIAAVLLAAEKIRPDCIESCAVVVGQRVRPLKKLKPWMILPFIILRFIIRRIRKRWASNLISIDMETSSLGLREWRKRAHLQPTIVFPEGKSRMTFDKVRSGSGRWLSGFDLPVVPVGGWWHGGCWHVRFGAPIHWAERADLRDVQLGLAMASLLPPELAPTWQADLARWRAVRQKSDSASDS